MEPQTEALCPASVSYTGTPADSEPAIEPNEQQSSIQSEIIYFLLFILVIF